MSFVGAKHKDVLKDERSIFVAPWLINHLQGKHRILCFKKQELFLLGRHDCSLHANAKEGMDGSCGHNLCSDDGHCVGLAINLRLWYVEVLDSCPILTNNMDFF